jgi:hypothetical protein
MKTKLRRLCVKLLLLTTLTSSLLFCPYHKDERALPGYSHSPDLSVPCFPPKFSLYFYSSRILPCSLSLFFSLTGLTPCSLRGFIGGRWGSFLFKKRGESSWVSERLSAYQEGHCYLLVKVESLHNKVYKISIFFLTLLCETSSL